MATPAEERAARQGLPVVLATPFDLLRIAEGNPMILGTVDGQEVLVKLPSVDEYLAEVERAGAKLAAEGLPPGPGCTRDQAERLVRPLGV